MESEVPTWLEERFPGRGWKTLRHCKLRVHEQGAGLDMEESEHGYVVEAIGEKPGQDPLLQRGDAIIAIEGHRLMGLQSDDIGEIFGTHFRDGANLVLLTSNELKEAVEDDEAKPDTLANYELLWRTKSETEHEATVRIPVGRATAWQLDDGTMADLQNDLSIVRDKFGLSAQAHFNDAGMESVVLCGLPSAIAKARPEVVQILNFYREGRPSGEASKSPGSVAPTAGYAEMAGAVVEARAALVVPNHVADLRQFQYHDHTADIIVHAWGKSRSEAFAQVCVGMFNYMTPLDNVAIDRTVEVEAKGHDMLDLLYHLLDEFLYIFGTEMHISKLVEIVSFDEENFCIKARGYGEKMDLKKHEQGTEIKAITMHMMKILGPDVVLTENGSFSREDTSEKPMHDFPHEAYVLLDI